MELRRAILLFAIVLGVAAIVSSVARPPDRGSDDEPATTERATGSGGGTTTAPAAAEPIGDTPQPTTVELRSGAKPRTSRIELGQPATVLVDVETPGEIAIPSLGLADTAEPLTPAMFEVLETTPGSHAVMLQPAASDAVPKRIGTLKVVPAS